MVDESIFMKIQLKIFTIHLLIIKSLKNIMKTIFKKFGIYPNEITILTYDALGLIYYAWKTNDKINSINDFMFKNKIKGKIGTFSFKDRKVIQELDIYKTDKNKFIKF